MVWKMEIVLSILILLQDSRDNYVKEGKDTKKLSTHIAIINELCTI